jgi:hypothetical protein
MKMGFFKKISWKKKDFQEQKEISRESIAKDWAFLLSFFFVLFIILTAGYYTLFTLYKKPRLINTPLNNLSSEEATKKYNEALIRVEVWKREYQEIETSITMENFSL